MLQTFKNRPNLAIAPICAVVLAVVFLIGIVTAPADPIKPPTYVSTSLQ